ncbi:MAG: PDZ domain-containing protein [Myxococcota bacterium]
MRALAVAVVSLVLALGCGPPSEPDASRPDGPAVPAVSRTPAGARPSAEPNRPPRTFAVLINGGARARINYQSHVLHLREMIAFLQAHGVPRRRIWVFSSDGRDPEPDLAVRDVQPEPDFWLIERTGLGVNLRTEVRLENTRIEGTWLIPATRKALMRWASVGAHRRMRPGDTLLVYVTDHGEKNREDLTNNAINLWEEKLSVDDFREWIVRLPRGVRVVTLMSQCYSGSFANVIQGLEELGVPEGAVCGYFSSSAERPASGCYPENRGKDNVGHSFRFFEGLRLLHSLPDAHERVLLTDRTPDVPNRTSDQYLEHLLRSAADLHGVDLTLFVDDLLGQVDSGDPAYVGSFAQVDHIGHAFGSFTPRSLTELELKAKNIPALSKELASYSKRWRATLDDLRRENVRDFLALFPAYREYQNGNVAKALTAEEKRRVTAALLDDLVAFTATHPERERRLRALRKIEQEARDASYRMAVREAVVERMRTLLLRIAGLAYLERLAAAEEREEFDGLSSCEALHFEPQPGENSEGARSLPPPFPQLEEESLILLDVMPGWIGIQFKPIDEKRRRELGVARGAVVVQNVLPDSPASAAGLERDDIILGPPGHPFQEPRQIREWVMTSIVGEERAFEVLRDGEPIVLYVLIGPPPI